MKKKNNSAAVGQGPSSPSRDAHAVLIAQLCQLFPTPWTVAHQAPLSMGFSRKNIGVGCHFLLHHNLHFSSVQFSSVAQSCPTLCDPMNSSTPGLPVHHQLLEFTQTHVHRVGDVIQPSQPLSSPSTPDPNPSQHQGLFQ